MCPRFPCSFLCLQRIEDPLDVAPSTSPGVVGYVDVHGGFGAGSEDVTFGPFSVTDEWDSKNFGGAGRVAVPVDHLLLNFDARFNSWFGSGTETGFFGSCNCDWSQNRGGVAAHLAWMLDGAMIGGLGSIGSDMPDYTADGLYVSTALDGMAEFENVRMYGQAGYTGAVEGHAAAAKRLSGLRGLGVGRIGSRRDVEWHGARNLRWCPGRLW